MPDDPANPNRDDVLAALIAAPPPRPVPPGLLRSARRQAAPMVLAFVGILMAGFGSFFAWMFFPWGFWHDWELDRGQTLHASGIVRDIRGTYLTIGGTRGHPGPRVVSNEFTFTPAGGQPASGECYTTGGRWLPGTRVDVEYLASDPSVARIVGSRTTCSTLKAGAATLFFPIIGLLIVAWPVALRRRAGWLLRNGELGEATVQEVKETLMTRNKRRVYRITLLRKAASGDVPLIVRRSQPDLVAFFQSRLESRQPVYVLFDPARPARALFPEALP